MAKKHTVLGRRTISMSLTSTGIAVSIVLGASTGTAAVAGMRALLTPTADVTG